MKKRRIQNKLFLTIYTIFISIIFLFTISFYFFIFQNLEKSEIKNLAQVANSTKKNLELMLKLARNFDEVIYKNNKIILLLNDIGNKTVASSKPEINTFLENFVLANSSLKGIHILGNNNTFFSSNKNINIKHLREILSGQIIDDDFTKLSVNYYLPFKDYEIISYIVPIYDFNSNKKVGTLIIDLDYDNLNDIFITSAIGSEEKIFVTDTRKNIIFKFPADIDFNYTISDTLIGKTTKINKNFLISPERVNYSNWVYTRIIPISDTIIKFRNFFNILIFMLFLILAISMWLTLKFSIIFSEPIIELSKKFNEMENGNLDTEIKFNRNDEIGELGNSFNKTVKTLKKLFEDRINDQKQKDELKFKILQEQINPHFLYNTLDSIRWLAVINNIPSIKDMTIAIINLLRYNISTEDDIVTISQELESVKNYLTIQKYRFGHVFDVEYNIDESLIDCQIIRFTLQPIFENIFYHAFDLEEKRGIIMINLYKDAGLILLEIKDNGKGFTMNEIQKSNKMHTGIGIKNIDERIKLFFGKEYGLNIRSAAGNGTTVTIILPVIRLAKIV